MANYYKRNIFAKKASKTKKDAPRRGKTLEKWMETAMDEMEALPNVIPIRLEVKTVRKGDKFIHTKKQICDYLYLTPNGVWVLDAKECGKDSWRPPKSDYKTRNGIRVKMPNHQVEAFNKILSWNGTVKYHVGFVVWFTKHGNVPGARRFITKFSERSTIESGEPFSWNLII